MVETRKSLSRNYLYSFLQQFVSVALPLVTVPYLSRVLGPEGLGIVAFSGSIVQYFTLLGGLGLALYGNRAVARVREDKANLSQTFWEIFSLRASLTLFSLLCFLVSLLFFKPNHPEVYLVQSFLILSAALDLSWLYMALEDFRKIVIRNVAIRLVGLMLIFLLVRRAEDFVKYAVISVFTELLGQGIYWAKIRELVNRPAWSELKWRIHVRPTLGLFIPQLAIQVYVVLDKTMLGLLSSLAEVALYAQPEKIIKALLMLITTLGTVMLPRMSHLYANKREAEFKDYARKSLLFTSYGTFLFAALAYATSSSFIPLFLGNQFLPSVRVFQILSPIIVLIGLSNVLGIQMLIPMGKEKILSISVIAGALTNFSGNLFLISRYGANGAAVATLLAEGLVSVIQYYCLRRENLFQNLSMEFFNFFLGAIACVAVAIPFKLLIADPLLLTGAISFFGALAYMSVLGVLHSGTQKELFNRIHARMHKNKAV